MTEQNDPPVIDYAPAPTREPIQSRLGIASISCALLALVVLMVWFVLAAALLGIPVPLYQQIIYSCLLISFPLLDIAGIVTGIVGCIQKRRRRSLAVAGLVISIAIMIIILVKAYLWWAETRR